MIFIPGNVASSKNSKINTSRGSFMSKTVKKYLTKLGIQSYSISRREVTLYKTKPLIFPVEELTKLFSDINYPVLVGFHFVRGTKHSADFHNLVQILFDLMQAFEIIPEDDMDHVFGIPLPIDDKYYSYDKDNPGVYIDVVEVGDLEW